MKSIKTALLVFLLPVFATRADPATGSAVVGQTVTISVTADGTTPFSYQWWKNGARVTNATAASLILTPVGVGDAGTYYAVVSNVAGSATSDNAVLSVLPLQAPVFTTQPASQAVNLNAPVTFAATATGTPGPGYQWRKNGANIAGATSSSYSIASVTAADAGTYTVVATNSSGAVTSNGAVLAVNQPPTIHGPTITVTGIVASNPRQPFSMKMAAAAPPPARATFQWTRNGQPIPGATSADYTVPNASLAVGSTFGLLVRSGRTVTKSPVALTVNPNR